MPGPDFSFYQEASEASKLKGRIVSKYFWAWCTAMVGATRSAKSQSLRYVDLFAGAGVYADGTKSTPLLVLPRAIGTPYIRDNIQIVFNDKDPKCISHLQSVISELPQLDTLRHEIRFLNFEVGQAMFDAIGDLENPPTLYFVDPWGYKGLSLELLLKLLKGWGCDCVFFFNYNRINPALDNPIADDPIDALFGADRASGLRLKIEGKSPHEREAVITEEIALALKDNGIRFVLPFGFRNETGHRTTHHLIFASKHNLGYKIMKDIMARESSEREGGVASFAYTPVDNRQLKLLFALSRTLDDLQLELPKHFAGRSMAMRQIIDEHHVDTPFVEENYREVLLRLEVEGSLNVDKPRERRMRSGKATLGLDRLIRFPPAP